MTGLDPEKDHVLEVACLVTDGQLNVIAEGPNLVIQQSQEVLNNMNEWSTKQHAEVSYSTIQHKIIKQKVILIIFSV